VTPSKELTGLLTSLDDLGPTALSSCPGWDAHHLAAHIAGNYEEVRTHVEAFDAGQPLARTRHWEEREAPLRRLDYAALVRRIESEAARASAITDLALERRPDARLLWTNRTVAISGFPTHMRSEDALHRWDLVGDDDTSNELLGQQDLLVHAVTFIGQPLLSRGRAAGATQEPFVGRVRSPGRDDLVVDARNGEVHLAVGPQEGPSDIEGDPAARLLLLWGRKPTPFSRLSGTGHGPIAFRLQALLAGY
jgi:Mycothiol maleylpyruvate isomerase N-terminal domain